MNVHYIDYMIRERRREELEECEKLRLLNSAGYSQSILIHKVCRELFNVFHRLLKKRSFGHRGMQLCSSMPKVVARTEEEG